MSQKTHSHSSYLMTDSLCVSQFVATVLMLIRRKHTSSFSDFKAIVTKRQVVDELEKNWDYYHMYDYKDVIEELAVMEPLIKV